MRPLFFLLLGLLQGCTPAQQSMMDTFDTALKGDKDITLSDEFIRTQPYSSMYLRLNQGQQIFVVLGFIEQGQSKWLTADNAMIVTRQGRLLKTTGLKENLLEVRSPQHDPLSEPLPLQQGASWQRVIRWQEEGRERSSVLSSQFSSGEETVLTIAGEKIVVREWLENVQSQTPDLRWQNRFWIDVKSGVVRRSEQTLGAGFFPVDMTFLKPAP
ncbi:YjbF family lipoprotein [Enterobacteriaceae bacterium C34A]